MGVEQVQALPLDVCQKLADEHKSQTGHSHSEARESGRVVDIACDCCQWQVLVECP